jgi:pimeloyl-ACP methyl ester carboxylesterase
MNMCRIFALFAALLFTAHLHAQEIGAGEILRVDTREGVSVPLYTYWQTHAVATIVLFSGGAGGYGQIGEDGWPGGGNFLIRTGKQWAFHPFNVVMVGRPSDGIDLSSGHVRTGSAHAVDNVAIFKAIKLKSRLPLWVVGTSMGTISTAAAAIQDSENLISGVVLTSSIVAYKIPGAVPKQNLEKIRIPTLILHHEDDACWACRPYEARNIVRELTNAPIKKAIFVSGGSGATGNPCEPMHHHGFVGMQKEAVDIVASWMLNPTQ